MDFDNTLDSLQFSEGDVVMVIGIAAVAQRVKARLQTFIGEWFLDQGFGPNYIKDVLKKSPSLNLVESVIRSEINKSLQGEAVLRDLEIALISSTRKLDVSFILRDSETDEDSAPTKVVIG